MREREACKNSGINVVYGKRKQGCSIFSVSQDILRNGILRVVPGFFKERLPCRIRVLNSLSDQHDWVKKDGGLQTHA